MTEKVIETTNGWYMKNDKEPVELDDIVGLIKTDEPTDSVQLKKEAQLSICEKRIIELRKENEQLKNSVNILDKVRNELIDENEQLKQVSQDYEDNVKNWFIENWGTLSLMQKASAHLELGIDIEYDGDV